MFKLIKGGEVYAPMYIGKKDILLLNGKIIKISSDINIPADFSDTKIIDATGKYVTPGFIDYHNHFLGGGGNSGYTSRAPEIPLSRFIKAGITTVVGCLGADSATRSMGDLYGKACSLEAEGITTFIYSGATYTHPIPTLTGSIQSDMYYVDKVIGAGEVSLSELGATYDSFGSGAQYIAKLASQTILAARMGKKAGLICLQVPPHGVCLEPLFGILDKTNLPIQYFIPAHANQGQKYFESVIKFAKRGGIVDLTSSYTPKLGFDKAIKPSKALKHLLKEGISYDYITMSTDAGGAHPHGNYLGRPTGSDYLPVGSLFDEFRDAVVDEGLPLENVLQIVTSNVSRALFMPKRKGIIVENADADLLVLTKDIRIDKVIAKGQLMADDGKVIVTGAFEQIV